MAECENEWCPYPHDLEDSTCYQAWRRTGEENNYIEALGWPLEIWADKFMESETRACALDWLRFAGREGAMDNCGHHHLADWLREGRAQNWLIYRQFPETYLLVPDETGGKALEVLLAVTQANWESVHRDLSIEQLRWIAILAIRLLETALLTEGEVKDRGAQTASPLLALARVATEMSCRLSTEAQPGEEPSKESSDGA